MGFNKSDSTVEEWEDQFVHGDSRIAEAQQGAAEINVPLDIAGQMLGAVLEGEEMPAGYEDFKLEDSATKEANKNIDKNPHPNMSAFFAKGAERINIIYHIDENGDVVVVAATKVKLMQDSTLDRVSAA